MTIRPLLAAAATVIAALSPALAADPLLSNITAARRAGTKPMDITYDVTADTLMVKVTLEISSDAGVTYSVPVTSATGAVGNGNAAGAGKSITWDAGVDWDGKYSSPTRFRLVTDDLKLQPLVGLSGALAGLLPASSCAGEQSVAALYVAKTEVTWIEFQTVSEWAAANGYDQFL